MSVRVVLLLVGLGAKGDSGRQDAQSPCGAFFPRPFLPSFLPREDAAGSAAAAAAVFQVRGEEMLPLLSLPRV